MGENPYKSLDIILPCYNPRKDWHARILNAVDTISATLPNTSIGVILVNDGSTSGVSSEQISHLEKELPAFSYYHYEINKGKGYALRHGVSKATRDLQIFTDVDFPYEETCLIELYHKLNRDQADVIVGYREETYYEGVPSARKRISKLLRWTLRNVLNLKITDTQCGLKGFNRSGRELFRKTRINRFLFDLEFVFFASNERGIRVAGTPAELKKDIVFSKVNWRILLSEFFNFLKILIRYIGGKLFGKKG